MNDTVLFAGAGLSAVAGLPTTTQLTEQFLNLPETTATPRPLQELISQFLRRYWEQVFHYDGAQPAPSFEDHFTVLDLAANTGHHLGPGYSPKRLRAIRRLSIHRVFDILDSRFQRSERLFGFIRELAQGTGNSIITTNWDIAIELHLNGSLFHYGLPMLRPEGTTREAVGIQLLKLHGSSNWAYCDCCGRLYSFDIAQGKGALHNHVFIEPADFDVLHQDRQQDPVQPAMRPHANCAACDVRLSSRVATFSYTKVLDFAHFLAVWDRAFRCLRDASHWIFVGYSLPEADYQLRHMLKTAQLGRRGDASLSVTAVLSNDDRAADRFRRFFGTALQTVDTRGFEAWATERNVATATPHDLADRPA